MTRRTPSRAARLWSAATLLLLALASGCGDAGVGQTYPVLGKVTIDGKPLVAKSATVTLVPNTAKGNTSPHQPAASIDSNGDYTVYTKTQLGAPPGCYKIVVAATTGKAAPRPAKASLKERPIPESLVPARYGQTTTTPLEIEVVESPAVGAYDLNVTK